MNNDPINLNETLELFRKGELSEKSTEFLTRCSRGIANSAIKNEEVRHFAPAVSEHIHHLLLAKLLKEQETRNKKSTIIIIILAVATLLSTLTQIGIALHESQTAPTSMPTEQLQACQLISTNSAIEKNNCEPEARAYVENAGRDK